ncbi:hypothetical protein ZWY2020_053384 [Hordeum vulgare]|nr:hypothetical protein ZWY2020_053384 [Hordeum vulgare]
MRWRRSGDGSLKAPGGGECALAGGWEPEGAPRRRWPPGQGGRGVDSEGKLLRTVFVENLPLRTKKKALTKEFTTFGVVDSVRICSVPLGDVSVVH